MAAKKCPKCGKTNPHFFTHCVECGTKLDAEIKKADNLGRYLKVGLILVYSHPYHLRCPAGGPVFHDRRAEFF